MDNNRITRRGLLLGSLTLVAGCVPTVEQVVAPVSTGFTFDPRYQRRSVGYETSEKPGSIVVDTSERYLYFVEEDGKATRYGVGVGEEGLTLKGRATVGRKAEWPSWTPTADMLKRKPRLLQYAGGVPGGPENPLGARALYLYRGKEDTKFRVHGTNEPWTIGHAVSNGCIRMFNEDVIELYDRAPLGTPVLVT
jgi:lipoprotein-anchoring transpeptidase ErfK/SrfK